MNCYAFALNPRRRPRTPRFHDDPNCFSYEALQKLGKQGVEWDWIKERNSLRYLSRIKNGDRIVIYNTQGDLVVKGFAEAIQDFHISLGSGRPCVRIKATDKAKRRVERAAVSRLKEGKGPRQLSVFPITKGDYSQIRRLAGLPV